MKETNHDYAGCIIGNFYSGECTNTFENWESFKNQFAGFHESGYDDTYNFIFRYDINAINKSTYQLELCVMLQRKGIYLHLYVDNISQEKLDTEVKEWLKGRFNYIKKLWEEVSCE